MKIRLLKNGFRPEQSPNGCDGVGEGGSGLFVAGLMAQIDRVAFDVFGEDQAHDAEQGQAVRKTELATRCRGVSKPRCSRTS